MNKFVPKLDEMCNSSYSLYYNLNITVGNDKHEPSQRYGKESSLFKRSELNDDKVQPQQVPRPTLITDEGAGFKESAQICNLHHQYDRRHFVDKIKNHWHSVQDKEEYRTTVVKILDTADKEDLDELLTSALHDYRDDANALKLLQKIVDKKESLCFAFTSDRFTNGHVSSQRAESKNSSIKARGKLEEYLAQATIPQSLNIISRNVRTQDEKIVAELSELRRQNKVVGDYYTESFNQSKIHAGSFKCIEATSNAWEYKVRENSTSIKFSLVNLHGEVYWKGVLYCIPVCSCCFFVTTHIICSCICAAASRCEEFNIDDNRHIHPFFLVMSHPLWNIAIDAAGLQDYEDPPPQWTKSSELDKSREVSSHMVRGSTVLPTGEV